MKVSLVTLGCRMNRFDTDFMRTLFSSSGYEVTEDFDHADVYVINTCTVTSGGDRSSRQAIYRAKRINPSSIVIATGCYAQVSPQDLAGLKEVDIVVGNTHKREIVRILEEHIAGKTTTVHVGNIFRERDLRNFDAVTYFEGVRPFIKIQEGCNKFCSFCIIPFARGKVRSAPPRKVIQEVDRLAQLGFKEIVLTGTQLSQYGWDLGTSLYELLRSLIKTSVEIIRLSSLHIAELDDRTLDLLTSEEKIAPHFHLSLQSGSNRILRTMERGYTMGEYTKVVESIWTRRPYSAIGTDVIAGFPGESEKDFRETVRAVEELPFAYLHPFPYSDRKGTKASKLHGKIPPEVIKERVGLLKDLDGKKRSWFWRINEGRTVRAVVLKKGGVLTENYIEIPVDLKAEPGDIVKIRVPEEEENGS